MHQRQWIPIWVAMILLVALLSCSEAEQAQIQTAAAQAGQTAVAEGKNFAETQAAQLKETAVAQLATQLAKTVTELAKTTPSPLDVNWIPSDSQFVANKIDIILDGTGLSGEGGTILQNAQQFGVNPAFALAMFRKEATFAAPGTRAYNNKNPGNIIATGNCRGLPAGSSCIGYYGEISTDGRFGVYPSVADGIKAYFTLLSAEYKPGTSHNCSDIACIVTAYCPPSDCDTSTYISQITQWTQQYQSQLLAP
jgi:hypothetical protein